jgi:two-component system cell cycle response regulator
MEKSPDETFNLRQLRNALRDTTVIPNSEMTRPAVPEACLVCVHSFGSGRGKRFGVGARELVIGRDKWCAIPVTDQAVSRHHARVEALPDGSYQVTDLGSINGTFVNDVRVRRETLQEGSYLRVGECIFRFLAGRNVEAAYHQEIYRLTVIDSLTGLYNRLYLDEFLVREVERSSRQNRSLAVVLFSIDHFKVINKRLGYQACDFILKEFVTRMKALTREAELLTRYGEEEFALVVPNTTLDRAIECAERSRRAATDRAFEFKGQIYRLTVSAGVGFLSAGAETSAPDLLRQAGDRLFQAKRAGWNRVAPMTRGVRPGSQATHLINAAALCAGD